MAVLGTAALLVIVFTARGGSDDDNATTSEGVGTTLSSDQEAALDKPTRTTSPVSPEEAEKRRNAGPACERFRNVASGLPPGDELRNTMQEINDAAATATKEVQDAARAVLDAVTQNEGQRNYRYLQAGGELAKACTDAGH